MRRCWRPSRACGAADSGPFPPRHLPAPTTEGEDGPARSSGPPACERAADTRRPGSSAPRSDRPSPRSTAPPRPRAAASPAGVVSRESSLRVRARSPPAASTRTTTKGTSSTSTGNADGTDAEVMAFGVTLQALAQVRENARVRDLHVLVVPGAVAVDAQARKGPGGGVGGRRRGRHANAAAQKRDRALRDPAIGGTGQAGPRRRAARGERHRSARARRCGARRRRAPTDA